MSPLAEILTRATVAFEEGDAETAANALGTLPQELARLQSECARLPEHELQMLSVLEAECRAAAERMLAEVQASLLHLASTRRAHEAYRRGG